MAGYREGAEGAEVASVFEGEEAEGDDDEEDGFLVDMPAEEEGRVAAECEGADEVVPGRSEEELCERDLRRLLGLSCRNLVPKLTIWKRSVRAKVVFGVISGNTAKDVSPTKPLVTLLTALWSMGNPVKGATS